MNTRSLVLAGLRHHLRAHLGVLAGSAVATATLVGALVVGDSVRYTLARGAEARIGTVDLVLSGGDRFFRDALASEISEELAEELAGGLETNATRTAPAVLLPGVVSRSDGSRRVNDARVHGVDERFFALAPGAAAAPAAVEPPGEGEVLLATELAARLEVEVGDQLVLRLERPSAIPRDMSLAPEDVSVALRLDVAGIVSDRAFGSFSLDAGHGLPPNLFLSLAWLQAELEVEGRANLLLVDAPGGADDVAVAWERATAALRERWTLADAELAIAAPAREGGEGTGVRELSSSRIFLDHPIVEALERSPQLAGVPREELFTYFVNELRIGERATPYSMVTALGPAGPVAPGDPGQSDWLALVPPDDGAIVLNAWVAGDLDAAVGDELTLAYYVVDPSRKLVEKRRAFRVAGIVPIEGAAGDPSLMPAFPGLADSENCREWEPGTPVDLERIRDEDEVYWDDHGGTPKGFVTLAAGLDMWASRFGELTAVRFDADDEERVRRALAEELDPAELGLFFRDVRTPAEASSQSPTDFGGLFLGLSFFLIGAALLLTAQLFLFGVESRAREAGLFAALGFRPRAITRLFLGEAAVLALAGGVLGAPLGLAFTRGVLHGLRTVWADAVARVDLFFHAEPATVALGVAAAFGVTLATVWFASRRRLRLPAVQLLASAQGVDAVPMRIAAGRSYALAGLLALVALGVLALVDPSTGTAAAGAFFGAGAALLAGALVLARAFLRRSPRAKPVETVGRLGLANATRRPGRSLATVAFMAIPTFLVVAVGVNQRGPTRDTEARDSGTGGFALYGRTTLAVVDDLNTVEGRDFFALSDEDLEGVAILPLRVRDGDDASCLNLGRPAAPRLLGVDPEELARRGAFPFAAHADTQADSPWRLLAEPLADGAIPAIGDATSLTWQLKKAVGDTIAYTDERGRAFEVRIVGALADTILQGDLLIGTERFEELFPTQGGYKRFLIDAPSDRVEVVTTALSRGLEDVGLSLEASGRRLDTFHAVQNTYLSIFQLLGALGLLLGSIGLGAIVLRNTLERRGELALALALGFRPGFGRRGVRWLVLAEYGALLLAGLVLGGVAAGVAVVPSAGEGASGGSGEVWTAALTNVLPLVSVIAANGLLWILLAVRTIDARAPQAALREE